MLAPDVVRALLAWQLVQEREAEEWEVSTPAYIATAVDGSPLHPERLTRSFDQMRKLAGLRPTRLHDLRHAYATKLLEEGVPMTVVSKLLGHADIRTTVNTYGHVDVAGGLEVSDRMVATLEIGMG